MSASVPALRTEELRRRYGKTVALDGLDLEVPRGSVCGLVGPNGAGKTTAFGIVAGLIRPDSGRVDILGEGPFDPALHIGRVGLLPQDCALPGELPVRDLLRHYARLQGMSSAQASFAAARALGEVALVDRGDQRVHQLSHGMRRRVAVAQALLGTPELILLDEPTNGLDPDLVVMVRELLRSRAPAATLLVSSHVLHELEATCDHVVFMEQGRCVASGSLAELTGRGKELVLSLDRPAEEVLELLHATGLRARAEGERLVVTGQPGESAAEINRRLLPALLAAGVGVNEVRSGRSLEASWLEARALRP